MKILTNYKQELILAIALIVVVACLVYLYGIFLPFIIGLTLAFSVAPAVNYIQKLFKNRTLSTTIFLLGLIGVLVLSTLLLTGYVNRDFQRLNQSFSMLASQNRDLLDETGQRVKDYLGDLYDLSALESMLKSDIDSIVKTGSEMDLSKLDTEAIKGSFDKLVSSFPSNESTEPEPTSGFGTMYMLASTLVYFILILYNFEYFRSIKTKYFTSKVSSKTNLLWDDFDKSFIRYFKLRTKIVLLLGLLYLITFTIMGMPGTLLLTLLIIFLSY